MECFRNCKHKICEKDGDDYGNWKTHSIYFCNLYDKYLKIVSDEADDCRKILKTKECIGKSKMDWRIQLANKTMKIFIKKVDSVTLDFKKLSVEMVDNYLHKPQITNIWNGRKFKKKIIQWKKINIKFGEL